MRASHGSALVAPRWPLPADFDGNILRVVIADVLALGVAFCAVTIFVQRRAGKR